MRNRRAYYEKNAVFNSTFSVFRIASIKPLPFGYYNVRFSFISRPKGRWPVLIANLRAAIGRNTKFKSRSTGILFRSVYHDANVVRKNVWTYEGFSGRVGQTFWEGEVYFYGTRREGVVEKRSKGSHGSRRTRYHLERRNNEIAAYLEYGTPRGTYPVRRKIEISEFEFWETSKRKWLQYYGYKRRGRVSNEDTDLIEGYGPYIGHRHYYRYEDATRYGKSTYEHKQKPTHFVKKTVSQTRPLVESAVMRVIEDYWRTEDD